VHSESGSAGVGRPINQDGSRFPQAHNYRRNRGHGRHQFDTKGREEDSEQEATLDRIQSSFSRFEIRDMRIAMMIIVHHLSGCAIYFVR